MKYKVFFEKKNTKSKNVKNHIRRRLTESKLCLVFARMSIVRVNENDSDRRQ